MPPADHGKPSAGMRAIYVSAAASDADAAAELKVSLDGRRANIARIIHVSMLILRPDLTAERATAISLSLTQAEVYDELMCNFHCSPNKYESWLAELLCQQLLP